MAFNKPNDPTAGVNPAPTSIQAQLDSVDLAVLAAGSNKTGVLSGCAVTQRAAGANMSVDVAAGVVSVEGNTASVVAVNKTIAANASGNPRLDLIVVSNTGTVTIVAGTPATAPDYTSPTVDGDGNLVRAVLAAVMVPTGATSITTATNITDMRVFVNFGDLLDVSTATSDNPHTSWTLTDNTDYSHNQTGGVDDYAAQTIIGSPTVDSGKTLPFYSGLSIQGAPTVAGTLSQSMAIHTHWDAPAGVTTPLHAGLYAHVGVAGGTVTKARGIHIELLQLFGQITMGTGFYFMASMALQTFGLKIGGVDGKYWDKWPSYHMGPLAMGGTPTAGVDGGLFNPVAMLDIRELRQLVYTVLITATNGSPTITIDATAPTDTVFDYLFDGGAAISGAGITGGTTLIGVQPSSATMSTNFTGTTGTLTATITKVLTDENASALRLTPQYDGAATVVRHNYIRFNRPALTNSAAVTDAAALHYPAAFGTHEALASGTTKTTPGGVDGWLKVNVSGTIYFVPAYASKTA